MKVPNKKDIELLESTGHFDADWYRRSYPDVVTLGMDPAWHYLTYGYRIGRDPGPNFSSVFAVHAHGMKDDHEPATRLARIQRKQNDAVRPDSRRVLLAAHEVARTGNHERAIALAEAYLPPELIHTIHVLRANAAIARSDEKVWLSEMNKYLAHYDVAPLILGNGENLFEKLSSTVAGEKISGPLITIIMPAWNAERTVKVAVRSILNQSWRNLELIIIDDASTDGTWSAIQELAASDERVRIRRNRVNVGPYVSKNIALQLARGEWITGHDADDWAHPDRLTTHVRLAERRSSRASITYMKRMQANGRVDHFTAIGPMSLDGANRISMISALFRREFLLDELGSWDCVRFGGDSELLGRARLKLGSEFAEFPTIGMICLDLETSLTNHPETGIRTPVGLSPIRTIYKDAWSRFHSLASSSELFFPFPQKSRKFEVAEALGVSNEDIISVLADNVGNSE